MNTRITLLLQMALLIGLSIHSLAQPKRSIPTMTMDDVSASRAIPSTPTPATKETSKNPGKEEKNTAQETINSAPTPPPEEAQKEAEKNWNERLDNAQERARGLELQADQTELLMTQLRNQLYSATARAPETHSQINARIAELFAQAKQLRAEAKNAQQEIEALQAEGNAKQYKVQQAALTNEKGEPNNQAYQKENDKLQSELQAAQAHLEVLQLRLSNNRTETLKNAGGDNFASNRMREEKAQATADVEATRAKIEALTNQLQIHRQKATSAGVILNAR